MQHTYRRRVQLGEVILSQKNMENQKEQNPERRRNLCELLLGVVMLILVAGINLYPMGRLAAHRSVSGISEYYTGAVNKNTAEKAACIVLDAGHGADDPGKIGCNDALEKDINLSVVKKLQQLLEKEGITVVLTRESDSPLYEAGAANRKMSDLNARIAIIEKAQPDLVVSIHQNSYHESSVSGPQVFYYKASEKGKKAADLLQASFDALPEIENRRKAKANDNYYLLLHTSAPLVIAECGFLSNPEEAARLVQETYQEKIASALKTGIQEYLKSQSTSSETTASLTENSYPCTATDIADSEKK